MNSDTEIQDALQSIEPSKSRKRKSRGRTTLPLLPQEGDNGKKIVLYNNKGQPVGAVATQMQTYLGVLARKMISIRYDKWSGVRSTLKDNLLERLEMIFMVDPRTRKGLLSSAATKWRQFKSCLTTKYIVPFISQPELLRSPPALYRDIIKQADWDYFVCKRVTKEFAKLREKQQKRRAHHVYHHQLSRKGYAGLEHELKTKTGIKGDIPREELWKAARRNKKGTYVNDMTRECAEKINELTRLSEKGAIATNGTNDILTLALGTPERSGRVRAVGGFVTPSAYFHSVVRYPESDAKDTLIAKQSKLIEEQQQMMDEIKTLIASFREEWWKNVPWSKNAPRSKNAPLSKNLPPSNNARRSKTASCSSAQSKICIEVTEGEGESGPRQVSKEKLGNVSLDTTENIPCKEKRVAENPLQPFTVSNDLTLSLKVLCRYAEKIMTSEDTIRVELDTVIFGVEHVDCLKEDVFLFASMLNMSNTSIMIYMAFLYKELQGKNTESSFAFVDPSRISFGTNNSKMKAKDLSKQLFLCPYDDGEHWVLVVINLFEDTVYFLDSLGHAPSCDVKTTINMAMRISKGQMYLKRKKGTTWKMVKECPHQSRNTMCGYFVMRYMKDITSSDILSITNVFTQKRTYSEEEIDEVRSEWADYVGNFI